MRPGFGGSMVSAGRMTVRFEDVTSDAGKAELEEAEWRL